MARQLNRWIQAIWSRYDSLRCSFFMGCLAFL